jgi:ribosomal-protein-alanine N-acetyltransferase
MIRAARTFDAKKLYQLESLLFSKEEFGLSLSSFYYHIKKSDLFVFEKDESIVGYILWLKRKKYYRLYSLGVSKEFQGLGIAKELLQFSFEKLPFSCYELEVKKSNTKAIKLYENYGFRVKKVLKNFYPNEQDGYLMVR